MALDTRRDVAVKAEIPRKQFPRDDAREDVGVSGVSGDFPAHFATRLPA